MESINNMAMAAAKAVWGTNESNEEPVSGKLGDTSKGEPYDAGNLEENETEERKNNDTKTETAVPETNPAETKDSSLTNQDSTKGQNDVRHPDDPQTHPEAAKPRENVDDSTGGTDEGDNPVKVDGPGPKPVEDVAREHGGDAGTSTEEVGDDSAVSGVDDEEEDGPQKQSHGEGTGEQYVKSSGLKADGGDFDASKPGAGREADRLLEEKGIKGSSPKGSSESVESKPSSTGKEKMKLKDKIKAKLHKSSVSS